MSFGALHQDTLGHSCLSRLSHCGLIWSRKKKEKGGTGVCKLTSTQRKKAQAGNDPCLTRSRRWVH